MSRGDPTRPLEVEGAPDQPNQAGAWQSNPGVWSFEGPGDQKRFSPLKPVPHGRPAPSGNASPPATANPQKLQVPETKLTGPPARRFGRRSSRAVYRWEGVVEEVNREGFKARLKPSRNGQPSAEDVEFTDFSFDEITPGDHPLIVPGALFYWTLARKTNEAGTLTNESLVRFRRIPPVGGYHEKIARSEAERLLQGLGGDGSS